MPNKATVRSMIQNEDHNLAGQVDFQGTRIDPGTVTPTAAYTVTSLDYGKALIATSLCRKFTLPLATAALAGLEFTFIEGRASTAAAGELWVDPVSADTINGGTTGIGLRLQTTADAIGDSLTLKCNGSAWYTISKIGTWAAASAA